MEKYRRVTPVKDADAPPPDDAVIRVQVQGKIANYVTYATTRLEDVDKAHVEIVGLGRAINTAVTVAEVLRRKIADIHQLTTLSSVSLKDHWEPLEEGLDPIETERTVSCIAIHLIKGGPGVLDTSAPGYSPPLVADESALVSPANLGAMDAADRDRGRGAARSGPRRGGGTGGRGRAAGPGAARGARGGGYHRRGPRPHGSGPPAPANGSGNTENGNDTSSRAAAPTDPKHAAAARPSSAPSAVQHSE